MPKASPPEAPNSNRAAAALARTRAAAREEARVPWNERPFVTVPVAADVLGCSTSQVYALATRGELEMVHAVGRTQVRVPSLARVVSQAVPYQPDGSRPRGAALAKARAARTPQNEPA